LKITIPSPGKADDTVNIQTWGTKITLKHRKTLHMKYTEKNKQIKSIETTV